MAVTLCRRRLFGHGWKRLVVWFSPAILILALVSCSWTGTRSAMHPRHNTPGSPSEASHAASGCSHVYRMSSVAYRQERAWPAVAGCVTPLLTRPMLRRCVEERARRRRRPTNILLLGDSRMRLLFKQLADELGVPTPVVEDKPYNGWKKGIRVDNSPERWCRVCPWHCCPRAAAAGGVSLQFLWRPFWTEAMVDALETAAGRCERGHHDCPDVVIVNGAMWYGETLAPENSGLTQMALLLRSQLAQVAAALARLAQLTRTVWKLDEGHSHDVRLRIHRTDLPELPVLHSMVYDMARKIPSLIIWTSALPESTGFLRLVCHAPHGFQRTGSLDPEAYYQQMLGFLGAGSMDKEAYYRQCGKDSYHASEAVTLKAIHVLFAEVCLGYIEMAPSVEAGQNNGTVHPVTCCSENDPIIDF